MDEIERQRMLRANEAEMERIIINRAELPCQNCATLTTERDRYRDAIHRIAQSDTAWESGVAAEVLNDLGYEWGERGATRQALEDEGLPDWRWMASLVMDWIRANDESMLAYIEKGKPSKEILQRRLDTSSALRSLYDVPWVKVAADRYKNAPWNARALAGTGETPRE